MRTIFVSSTFRDMQLERDAIQDVTKPLLNKKARQYNDSVSFCDLRWGIDTSELESEESSQKVMGVCLDEIDRCQEPIVVILGDRYGWIPEEEMVHELAGRKQLMLDDYRKSITALEIEYGALQTTEKLRNTLFYLRHVEPGIIPCSDAEDEEHRELQQRLISRIREISVTGVREYTVRDKEHLKEDIDNFAQMLAEDIEQLLMPAWEENGNLSVTERENASHRNFFTEKSKLFKARAYLCDEYAEKLSGSELVVLKGNSGAGKSTLLAGIRDKLVKSGKEVLAYECGLTSRTTTCFSLLKLITQTLCEKCGEPYRAEDDFDAHRVQMLSLCDKITEGGTELFVLVDAIDQLADDDYREKIEYLPVADNANVHIMVTALYSTQIRALEENKLTAVEKEEDKREVISAVLHNHHRELSEEVIEKILQKPGTENPLYLSFLIQRLTMMNQSDFAEIQSYGDGIAAINRYQARIVEEAPEDVEQMGLAVLKLSADRIAPETLWQAISYIGISSAGMRFDDLKALCPKLKQVDFSHYIAYMQENFILREDGRYSFSHNSLLNAVWNYLMNAGKIQELYENFYRYLAELPEDDGLRRTELIYQLLRTEDRGRIRGYIEQNPDDEHLDIIQPMKQYMIVKKKENVAQMLEEIGCDRVMLAFYAEKLVPAFGNGLHEFVAMTRFETFLSAQIDGKIRSGEIAAEAVYFLRIFDIVSEAYYNHSWQKEAHTLVQEAMKIYAASADHVLTREEILTETLYWDYKAAYYCAEISEDLNPEIWNRLLRDVAASPDWLNAAENIGTETDAANIGRAMWYMIKAFRYDRQDLRWDNVGNMPVDYDGITEDRKKSLSNCAEAIRLLEKCEDCEANRKRILECLRFMAKKYSKNGDYSEGESQQTFEKLLDMSYRMADPDTEKGLILLRDAHKMFLEFDAAYNCLGSSARTDERNRKYIEAQRKLTGMLRTRNEYENLIEAYTAVCRYYLMLSKRTAADEEKAARYGMAAYNIAFPDDEILHFSFSGFYTQKIYRCLYAIQYDCKLIDLTQYKLPQLEYDSLLEDSMLQDAYRETWAVLQILGPTYIRRHPINMRTVLYANQNFAKPSTVTRADFESGNLSEDTKCLMAAYYMNYWSTEEDRRKYAMRMAAKPENEGKLTLAETRKQRMRDKIILADGAEAAELTTMFGVPIGGRLQCVLDPSICMIVVDKETVFYEGFDNFFRLADELLSAFPEYEKDERTITPSKLAPFFRGEGFSHDKES